MKMCAAKIAEAEAWVEQNGLHPQACGATVKDFCKAMGITPETYYQWLDNSDFSEALTRARAKFKKNVVRDVENALIKAAKGVDFTQLHEEAKAAPVTEYDPNTGKKVRSYMGELKTVKAVRKVIYYPPNIEAAKFVLSNMAAEDWKLKQEVTHQGGDQPISVNLKDPKAASGLAKALASGAKPRKPKNEE